MKKILTIVGARPQFIKAAVLSRIIGENTDFNEIIVHTGQHFEANMSAIFFDEMQIKKPDYHFEIHSLPREAMIAKMVAKISEVIQKEDISAVLVYGDTNSTLAGALSAENNNIPLIHVEAGLRSFNIEMPEEINRITTDRLSDLLICPSQTAIDNLSNEKIKRHARVINCGDIMKDAVTYYKTVSEEKSTIIDTLGLVSNDFVLATIHRQENTDDVVKLKSIFKALEQINKDTKVVMPLHPRTKKALQKAQLSPQITFIEPVGYFDILALLSNCKLVVTDSGGLQKEAFFCNKYTIIVREQTEWVELVEHNFASLVGSHFDKMFATFHRQKNNTINFSVALYGANVGKKIYQEIAALIN